MKIEHAPALEENEGFIETPPEFVDSENQEFTAEMEKIIGKSIDQDDHNQDLKNFQSLDHAGSVTGQNKMQLDLNGMNPQSVRGKEFYQSQKGTERRAVELK